ncbi:hypothetical protein ACRALDRAFT_1063953 [Sodiomyces alcalophilus JCM 7366]|uniref:uncharacterized protein n=1 Tax=Sodiomyces alcalophilus JCM 7366 TaxID=591952 RepID=UPI0039B3A83A
MRPISSLTVEEVMEGSLPNIWPDEPPSISSLTVEEVMEGSLPNIWPDESQDNAMANPQATTQPTDAIKNDIPGGSKTSGNTTNNQIPALQASASQASASSSSKQSQVARKDRIERDVPGPSASAGRDEEPFVPGQNIVDVHELDRRKRRQAASTPAATKRPRTSRQRDPGGSSGSLAPRNDRLNSAPARRHRRRDADPLARDPLEAALYALSARPNEPLISKAVKTLERDFTEALGGVGGLVDVCIFLAHRLDLVVIFNALEDDGKRELLRQHGFLNE